MKNSLRASIIIPAFNRLEPLRATLRNAREACRRLGSDAEVIVVDDGSEPPLRGILAEFADDPVIRWERQSNQGSIIARRTGLDTARGRFVLFLDSDDLIAPDKLVCHCAALEQDDGLVIAYDDIGELVTENDGQTAVRTTFKPDQASDIADLLLRVQPPPHGCVYRRSYLERALASPLVSAERSLDPSGDVWLYYNLAVHPGRFVKIDLPLSYIGVHEEERYSLCWEALGVASLRLVEQFMEATADMHLAPVSRAREVAGERAFVSWRQLPLDFSRTYQERLIAVWRSAPRGPLSRLGGSSFVRLAAVIGPLRAGRLLRLRNHRYETCRTIDDRTLQKLLES